MMVEVSMWRCSRLDGVCTCGPYTAPASSVFFLTLVTPNSPPCGVPPSGVVSPLVLSNYNYNYNYTGLPFHDTLYYFR